MTDDNLKCTPTLSGKLFKYFFAILLLSVAISVSGQAVIKIPVKLPNFYLLNEQNSGADSLLHNINDSTAKIKTIKINGATKVITPTGIEYTFAGGSISGDPIISYVRGADSSYGLFTHSSGATDTARVFGLTVDSVSKVIRDSLNLFRNSNKTDLATSDFNVVDSIAGSDVFKRVTINQSKILAIISGSGSTGGTSASDVIAILTSNGITVTPPAPTNLVVNDSANTATFTPANGYATTIHQYSIDSGATYTTSSSNVISVGDVNLAAGKVRVRVMAGTNRNTGAFIATTSPFTTQYSTDITTLGGSSSTNSISGVAYSDNAVDKDYSTKWASAGNLPVYWQWDAGTSRNPGKLTWRTHTTGETSYENYREPKTFQVWGSNDGSFGTYTVLLTVANNAYTSDVVKSFTFTTTGSFRYFRVNITANQAGGPDSIVQASEITLLQ